jgi:hypothetical protein
MVRLLSRRAEIFSEGRPAAGDLLSSEHLGLTLVLPRRDMSMVKVL